MEAEADNKRRWPRVVPRNVVRAVVESAKERGRSVATDLSEGGACFAPARASLRPNDAVILSLSFPDHDPVAATGQVVWIIRREREPGRFGVRWTHEGMHRERLAALIRNCG